MDSTRLQYLFTQCVQGAATEKEQAELLDWMQRTENNSTAREMIHRAFQEVKDTEDLPEEDANAVLQAIFQVSNEQQPELDTNKIPAIRSRQRQWIPLSVAAALLGILVTGSLIFLKHSEEIVPELTGQPVEEITPANNKAVLTLADGSQISLDDADNGELKQQGDVQVIKLAGGKLLYKLIGDKKDGRLKKNAAISYNRLTTPRGGLFQITLPDESRVWLNSASSLKYPSSFTGEERRVELTGEGYFEIAPDKKRPFFVNLKDMQVQVLGTDFNIMAYEEEDAIQTSLVQGSVRVISGDKIIMVEPGQQASRIKEDGRFVLSKPNMEEVLGWRNGQMSFSSAELPAIMRQISRWYDVDIEYKEGIPPGRFNGLIDRNLKLSNVLEVLEVYGIHSTLEGRTVTVLPGAGKRS